MDEDKKDFGVLADLASVADILQKHYRGQGTVILELDRFDYDKAVRSFEQVDLRSNKFKIDISGTEFIYLLKEEE
jgi:hypothetical protein